MKTKAHQVFSLLLSLVMLFSIQAVTAHDEEHEAKPPILVEDAEEVSLEDWEGSWTNVASTLEAEELQEDIKKIADEHGDTPEEFIAEQKENSGTSFYSITFDGDTISFFDRKIEDGVDPVYEIDYKYSATYSATFGNHSFNWYIFEAVELPKVSDNEDADKDVMAMKPEDFRFIALMDIHGEEVLAHFHPRYGTTLESLWERDNWFPVLVNAEIPIEQYSKMLDHGDHDHDHE